MNSLLNKIALPLFTLALLPTLLSASQVKLERVPENGIQPQIAFGSDGTIHLIYFKGNPRGGDVFYTHKKSNEEKFALSMRVNSQPGAVIAIGTMRGPQLALGKGDRVHVTWMGSENAPKARIGDKEVTGLFHARLKTNRTGFEPEHNVITYAGHLDGGGTVAADREGNVYVLWHGSELDEEGEENRAVYLARSSDEGRTFTREKPALQEKTGSCACCGMRAVVDPRGNFYVLFRAALSATDRPQIVLVSTDRGASFKILGSSSWEVSTCPASTAAFFAGATKTLAAWESEGRVLWGNLTARGKLRGTPVAEIKGQRHPSIATNEKGETLVVWAEGTGWGKGGDAGWQMFDRNGKAIGEAKKALGLPVWSFAAAWPDQDGGFIVLY